MRHSTAGCMILLFLDARVYLSTVVSKMCLCTAEVSLCSIAVRVWFPYLRYKVCGNAPAQVDQALQVREDLSS